MPTSKIRIGYLPRPEIQEIIKKLSDEQNISQSKIVGILVEEALEARGISIPYLKNNHKLNNSNIKIDLKKKEPLILEEINELISDEGIIYEQKKGNNYKNNNELDKMKILESLDKKEIDILIKFIKVHDKL